MPIYIVGYDLKSGESYKSLTDYLRSLPKWWHCLDSTWIVSTDLSEEVLRDELWTNMYSDDKLLVVEHRRHNVANGCGSAWLGFDKKCGDWLIKNM